MSSRILVRIVVLLLSVILVFLILCTFLSSYLYFTQNSTSNIDCTNTLKQPYQYLEVNPEKENRLPTTTRGFVNLNRKLGDLDYESYRNDHTGNYAIITKFGGKNFRCSGECYCKSSPERRHATALSRGLTILISAFSSVMAMEIAKRTFNDHCFHQYFDSCPRELMFSEMESCDDEDEIEATEGDDGEGDQWTLYYCKGHCMRKYCFWPIHKNPAIKTMLEFGCERYDGDGHVKIRTQSQHNDGSMEREWNERARDRFIRRILDPFCQKIGNYVHHDGEIESFCLGATTYFINPSVVCVKKKIR